MTSALAQGRQYDQRKLQSLFAQSLPARVLAWELDYHRCCPTRWEILPDSYRANLPRRRPRRHTSQSPRSAKARDRVRDELRAPSRVVYSWMHWELSNGYSNEHVLLHPA